MHIKSLAKYQLQWRESLQNWSNYFNVSFVNISVFFYQISETRKIFK